MDKQSQMCQNTAGSRNAQESAILWLKVLQIIAKESGDLISGDVAKKFATIAARFAAAACSFRRFKITIVKDNLTFINYQYVFFLLLI